jgi:hypothetical protein
MLEPDTQAATVDRYITATEAILLDTEIAEATMVGRHGYGVN